MAGLGATVLFVLAQGAPEQPPAAVPGMLPWGAAVAAAGADRHGAGGGDALADRSLWASAMQTTPPAQAAAGWPFQPLPLVAKFGVPVPRYGITPIGEPPFRRVAVPPQPAPVAPGVASAPGDLPPGWWAVPLAAGVGVIVGRGRGRPQPQPEPQPPITETVIPEPATLILLSTGLLAIGLHGRRRRRRDQGTHAGR